MCTTEKIHQSTLLFLQTNFQYKDLLSFSLLVGGMQKHTRPDENMSFRHFLERQAGIPLKETCQTLVWKYTWRQQYLRHKSALPNSHILPDPSKAFRRVSMNGRRHNRASREHV